MKELSENETRYINKEKEYFKILSKLHEVTKQIRNYNNNSNNNKSRRVHNKSQGQGREEGKDDQRQSSFLRRNEEKEDVQQIRMGDEDSEIIEEEEIEIDNDIIIKRLNKKSSYSKLSSLDSQSTKSKGKRKENSRHSNKSNNNENDDKEAEEEEEEYRHNRSHRNKNMCQHLMNVRHKLKKEFLKHFNDNQKQLDNIYLIKELKIPTTLYKLIQESSKMWNSFLNTYAKLEESIDKLKKSDPLAEMSLNKSSINKLNLNLDNRDEVIFFFILI